MNKNILKIFTAVFALFLLCSLTCIAETDTAGNTFITNEDEFSGEAARDLYWAGSSRSFSGLSVSKSMLLAGRDITVSETNVGGSLRVGSYTLLVSSAEIADNVTAAGYSLQLSGVKASGVYLAGNTVNFNGETDSAVLIGSTVNLDGTVHGDALIAANSITLGSGLQVEGKLTIHSDNEPIVPAGAVIGTYEFNRTEEEIEIGDDAIEVKAEKRSGGFGRFVKGLFDNLLLAALICLLLGRDEMLKPGRMLFASPLPMLGIGFAALFVIPGIMLILLFIGIGLPSAGLLALLFALVCIHAVVFTGMTLANTLVPQFTGNKWLNNYWICSLIGALIFWLLRKIPVVRAVILLASLAYSLGYFIRLIYLRLRASDARGPKGGLTEKTDAPDVTEDALEPVKKAVPAEYVDPVLAESEELFASHTESLSPDADEPVSGVTADEDGEEEPADTSNEPEA